MKREAKLLPPIDNNWKRFARSTWNRLRIAEWGVHIIIYVLCGGLYGLAFVEIPEGFWISFFKNLFLQVFIYPAWYLFNDYCDYDEDIYKARFGGRCSEKPAPRLLICLSAITLVYSYYFEMLIFAVVQELIGVLYSARPIRLKTRGFLGVMTAALSQRLPFFWLLALSFDLNPIPAFFLTVYLAFTGLIFILLHQWEDADFDRLTNAHTWLVSHGRVIGYRLCSLCYGLLLISVVVVWIQFTATSTQTTAKGLFAGGYCLMVSLTLSLFLRRHSRKTRGEVLSTAPDVMFVAGVAHKKKAVIFGAGVAGMVAGIKLAEWGCKVEVHTQSNSLGGHNSKLGGVHVTHTSLGPIWEYIGIDLSHAFIPIQQECGYVYGKKYTPSSICSSACQRGNDPGSLDRMLFEIALKRKVEFHFSSRSRPIPQQDDTSTIFAAGLSQASYTQYGIPHRTIAGYHAECAYGREGEFRYFKDAKLGKDFGYVASAGSRLYALLFSRDTLPADSLEQFVILLQSAKLPQFNGWLRFTGSVPRQCSLFHNDKILGGTMCGMIDPFYLSGIPGALVSGKIAALAVFDRERASSEFDWFTRNWRMKAVLSNLAHRNFDKPYVYSSIAILNSIIEPVGTV